MSDLQANTELRADVSRISVRVQRVVAATYGNRCVYPGCTTALVAYEGEIPRYAGEIAHIRSPKPSGPRHDPLYPADGLDEEPNLVASCRLHHAEFDARPDLWPLATMLELRERGSNKRPLVWSNWLPELATLHFVNVPRILQLAAIHGTPLALPEDPPAANRGMYPARFILEVQRILPTLEMDSVRLTSDVSFGALPVGVPTTFARGVRTRNGPYPPSGRDGPLPITGLIADDPHIYMSRAGWRITMPYDPAWLTTNTAFSDMSGGQVGLAGVFIVKRRVARKDEFLKTPPRYGHLIATPLVFGISGEPFDSDLRTRFVPQRFGKNQTFNDYEDDEEEEEIEVDDQPLAGDSFRL